MLFGRAYTYGGDLMSRLSATLTIKKPARLLKPAINTAESQPFLPVPLGRNPVRRFQPKRAKVVADIEFPVLAIGG
jgi:hypothetical protein